MKKLFVFYGMMLCLSISQTFAQQGNHKKLQEALRQFINEKMELTEEEKNKFWPVADEMLFRERELRMNYTLKMEFLPENLSDKDAEEYFRLIQKFHQDEYEIHKQYMEKIRNILGVKKTVKFFALREEFKKHLIGKVKHKQENHKGYQK